MYTKVINPATDGRKVYDNKGSVRRTTNYLEKEAKAAGRELEFFSQPELGQLSADQVVELIDGNHKGLRQQAAKFYSLVLSPSEQELAALGTTDHALQRYVRDVMDLYAKNFNLKNTRQLNGQDLVWAAAVHQERQHRGLDDGQQGEAKAGLQAHVHVVVSARDAAQRNTLNPLGAAKVFNRVTFQAEAEVQLLIQLGWDKSRDIRGGQPDRATLVALKEAAIHEVAAANKAAAAQARPPRTAEQTAAKDAKLVVQVARINDKLHERYQLNSVHVVRLAKELEYGPEFYRRLSQVERRIDRGNGIRRPLVYLRTGVEKVVEFKDLGPSQVPEYQPIVPQHFDLSGRSVLQSFADTTERLAQKLEAASQQRTAGEVAPSQRPQPTPLGQPTQGPELNLDRKTNYQLER